MTDSKDNPVATGLQGPVKGVRFHLVSEGYVSTGSAESPLAFPYHNPLLSYFIDHYDPKSNAVVEALIGTGQFAFVWHAIQPLLDKGKSTIVVVPPQMAMSVSHNLTKRFGESIVGLCTNSKHGVPEQAIIVTSQYRLADASKKKEPWATGAGLVVVYEAAYMLLRSAKNAFSPFTSVLEETGGSLLLLSGTCCPSPIWALAKRFNADLYLRGPRDVFGFCKNDPAVIEGLLKFLNP
jgi:hypothetical protein